MSAPLVLTFGHSNRPLADTLALLRAHAVALVVDVRRWPRSRRHPWYDGPALAAALAAAGVDYLHLEPLGGHREPRPGSPNTALAEPASRGYADHMDDGDFAAALERLLEAAAARRTAVMCAEARPEHCHRALLCDALAARGARVEHAVEAGPRVAHRLTPGARAAGGRVTYPGPAVQLGLAGW